MSTLPLNADPSPFLPTGFDACPEQSRRGKRAAVLKHIAQSERLVSVRPASQLEVRPRPEMLSTGIADLDKMAGGIPRGCLTEICGTASSGKTSFLLATIAAATRREESCVLIDASDSFDPSSGAAAGFDFNKLLWIRCGFPLCNSVSSVVSGFIYPRGHPSTSLRAGSVTQRHGKSSERKLEQVMKATDLILQSGGFGLVALDLAEIPEKFVRRIPLASWFRFQRAVEHTKTALLVITEFPCAQTCATLALQLCHQPAGSHQRSGKPSHAQVLEGMDIEAEIMRSRLERKPMQSVTAVFKTQAVRAG